MPFGKIINKEIFSNNDSSSDDVEILFAQKVPISVNSINFRKNDVITHDFEAAVNTMRKLPKFGLEAVIDTEAGMMLAGLPSAEPIF
jgi:hypothetical protein